MFAKALCIRAGVVGPLLVVSMTAGCIVEASDSAPPPPVVVEPGRLTVRWMVSESVDPNLCVLGRAATIDIAVNTSGGHSAGEFQASCTAFATTISSLYPGSYVADALLIDAAGRPRTTNVGIRPFTILERTDLVIDVDFPADSFLDSLEPDAQRRASATEKAPGDAVPPSPASPTAASQEPISPKETR